MLIRIIENRKYYCAGHFLGHEGILKSVTQGRMDGRFNRV